MCLMRSHPILTLSSILIGAAASVGCGRPYHMEVQAVPSPFVRPGCHAVLEPLHSEQLMVGAKPEAVYVSEKKAESGESYMNDKAASAMEFQQRLMGAFPNVFAPGGAPDNTFTIRPTWTHWEPGSVVAFGGARPSVADLIVEVVSPQGQVLDKFDLETAVGASIYNPSSGGRMRSALKRAGNVVAAYMGDNWLCAH